MFCNADLQSKSVQHSTQRLTTNEQQVTTVDAHAAAGGLLRRDLPAGV